MDQEKLTGKLLRIYTRKSRLGISGEVDLPSLIGYYEKDGFGQDRLIGWGVEGEELVMISQEGYNSGEDET